jgi:hypothetical protein
MAQENEEGLEFNETHQLMVCHIDEREHILVYIKKNNIGTLLDASNETGLEMMSEKTKNVFLSSNRNVE